MLLSARRRCGRVFGKERAAGQDGLDFYMTIGISFVAATLACVKDPRIHLMQKPRRLIKKNGESHLKLLIYLCYFVAKFIFMQTAGFEYSHVIRYGHPRKL